MEALHNEEVRIAGNVTLAGTLTFPDMERGEAGYPAVLILPGTGSLNRDGNDEKGKMPLNLYRELAEYMTSLGFVTLRYDKRGVGASEGKTYETGMWDLVNDAERAVEFLREHPQVNADKVFVLGHSEGTILATALNARNPVSGLVLLAGSGTTLDSALKMQQELAYSELEKLTGFKGFLINKFKMTDKLRKKNEKFFEKILNSDRDVMRMNFVRVSSKWFREHFTYDIVADYEKITCPVLAITGKKDFQADYRALETLSKYIHSPLEIHVIETMNHGLKEQKEDVSILDAKKLFKADIGKDLHSELKLHLSNWLLFQMGKKLA